MRYEGREGNGGMNVILKIYEGKHKAYYFKE
jgi:hypothetical protein